MHYYVGLIQKSGLDREQAFQQAHEVLAKFDMNKELPEYKLYLDNDQIREMSEYYKTADTGQLVEKLEGWMGDPGGADEQGLYIITTRNPEGHFDSWSIEGFLETLQQGIFTFPDTYCEAIITSDGIWHEDTRYVKSPEPGVFNYPNKAELENARINAEWELYVSNLIEENLHSAGFLVRIHR